MVGNDLNRQFHAERPNQKWVTDVTEFKVQGMKLYLSPIMDLYNGEIVAYQIKRQPVFDLVGQMLEEAIKKLSPDERPMIHSDQGWQYQHENYRHMLEKHSLKQSMSRRGNCPDNAAMESFFGTLKSEFFYLNSFDSIESLEAGLVEYIQYYNQERIKLKLKGLSPVQYREQAQQANRPPDPCPSLGVTSPWGLVAASMRLTPRHPTHPAFDSFPRTDVL